MIIIKNMDILVQELCEAIGAKWAQLYARLGLDYRGRYKISVASEGIEPEKARFRQCAVQTIEKWQLEPSVKDLDERDKMKRLLTCLQGIKDKNIMAVQLALKHGIELDDMTVHLSDTSPTQSSGEEVPRKYYQQTPRKEDYEWIWKTIIDFDNRTHKFAVLDICQRISIDHFQQFCIYLGLQQHVINSIVSKESLHEEQYYHAFKTWINSNENVTFNDLKFALLSCSQSDLLQFIIYRINPSS